MIKRQEVLDAVTLRELLIFAYLRLKTGKLIKEDIKYINESNIRESALVNSIKLMIETQIKADEKNKDQFCLLTRNSDF